MGKLSQAVKDRRCQHCQKTFLMNARDIKAHAGVCKRVTALGLHMVGGIVKP